jgi:hypothetical protein
MSSLSGGDGEGQVGGVKLLSAALKIALALGALGYLVAQSTSARYDYKGLSRLAADITKKFPEPAFTGSVDKKPSRPSKQRLRRKRET